MELKPKSKKVAKHNELINASYNLETSEQRLILLAIAEVRKTNKDKAIDANTVIDIPASSYATMFKTTTNTAYSVLKEAGISLKKREFTFVSERNGIVHGSWLQHVEYVDKAGILSLAFTLNVIPYISQLEENFTSYEINQITQLTSKYAIRLYELLIQWQNKNCETPVFKLDEFRTKLGLQEDEYTKMSNFKKRILEVAVNQINTFSNIEITEINQITKGRTIEGFQFKYTKKTPEIDVTPQEQQADEFIKLTLAQTTMFSEKLSRMDELSHLAVGNESFEQLAVRIAEMLLDEEKQKDLRPYLVKAGYKPKSKKK